MLLNLINLTVSVTIDALPLYETKSMEELPSPIKSPRDEVKLRAKCKKLIFRY